MAPPTGAFVLRNAVVTIDTVEYANQCTRAELTPEAENLTLRTLVPDGIVQDVDSNVWTFNLAGIQDMTLATGLARTLDDMHGQQIDVVLEPKAGGVGKTFTAVAKSPSFGGEQGGWATFEVELPVIGQPVTVDPV